MYLEYFGLDDYPFDGLPDRRFYYVGVSQHQSLGLLTTALSRSGSICVLSGASGAGKTTLVRMLMRSLPRRMRIIAIDDPRLEPHMLLATILRASGVVATSLESIAELTLKLRQMLEKSIAMGIITTVICDEAQGLSDDVLEQIRLISNIEGEAGKMINFLLVGQEDLVSHLNKPEHDMLKNRIKIFAQLPRLKEEEVGAYLTYRLQQCSCMQPIFTNKAIAIITKKSHGVPRLINAMADMCLNLAFQKKKEQVNSLIANKAARIVLYNKVGFKEAVRQYCHELFNISLYERILVIAAAACCALGAFAGTLYLMNNYYKPQSIAELLIKDEQVQERYQEVTTYLFQGRNASGRELYYFNQAISQAYFRSEAFARLFKLYGYAVDDAYGAITTDLLHAVGLERLEQVGSFEEAISYDTPVLFSLIDDNLTPFYVILYRLSDDVAQLIIGDYLFDVKLSYVKERYQGSYTLLFPYMGDLDDLHSRTTDTRKAMENRLRPYLEQYWHRALEAANREANLALSNYDEQKRTLESIQERVQSNIIAGLDTSELTDEQIQVELDKLLKKALEQSRDYQEALLLYEKYEQISNEKETYAKDIRSISFKLDDGFKRGLALFMREQGISEFDQSAMAKLCLMFAKEAKLLNVVDTGAVGEASNDVDSSSEDSAHD